MNVGEERAFGPSSVKQLKLALREGVPVVMVRCYVLEFVDWEGAFGHDFLKQPRLALSEGLSVVMVRCYVLEFVDGEGAFCPFFLTIWVGIARGTAGGDCTGKWSVI